MSNAAPITQIVPQVESWVEETASDQLDDLAEAYDENEKIPLRGESIELSIRSLIEDSGIDRVEELITEENGPQVEKTVETAVRSAVIERCDADVDDPLSDGWSIEWVDPVDEMYIDISTAKSRYTGEMVAIKGRVRKKTDPIPWFRTRFYLCQRCYTEQRDAVKHEPRDIVRGITRSPYECEIEGCKAGQSDMETIAEKCDKRDYQYVTIEQEPGADGSTPAKIGCWLFGEGRITDAAEGERVTVVGRLRLNPDSDPEEYYIDVSSVITEREDDSVEVTEEDRQMLRDLVDDMDDPLSRAASNLAPHVHGRSLAKRALTLVAVGGGMDDASEQTHMMLIGDPSTGKTELTAALREVVPSTRKASLTQSSSVGLTASAVKEEVAGNEEWVIRAGAISLANGGILTVDELDEADFDLSKLNDALSEGEIPVDKAGKSTRVKTDTRVVATANPEDAEFDPMEPLGQQIQFSADVVSRFDIAIPFMDDSDDADMNEGILNATAADYLPDDEMSEEHEVYTREIDLETMQKWFAFAQEKEPRMTDEAVREAKRGWEIMREADDGAISLSPRRLRTIFRLARAHARLRFGDKVTEMDAKIAFRLISEMLGEWGYDIEGGETDEQDSMGQELAELADD